jgi:hypothetical protein
MNTATGVETSLGTIHLTSDQKDVLSRLEGGICETSAGLAFFNAVVATTGHFPPEWEVLVLRAALRDHPSDAGMLARLATLEERLHLPPAAAQLAFERDWARFSTLDVVGATDSEDRALRLARAIDSAASLLASPIFAAQSLARRVGMLLAIHDTLMSVPNPQLPLIADLGLRQLRAMLDDPALTEGDAFGVYDCLHALYFAGCSDVRDLRRFDAIVAPFEAWLESRHGHHERPRFPKPNPEQKLTIAYLLHTAHFHRGNAVSPLVVSLAEMHATRADRRILVYAVQYVEEGFAVGMRRRGIETRIFAQDRRYALIDDIAESIRADQVDVVITEQNRSVAAALFTQRVAPRQIWLDTGFPYWSLQARDWTISPGYHGPADPDERISGIALRQAADTLSGTAEPAAIASARAALPKDAFVIGVFVRLIKLDRDYLKFLKRLLAANPRFHLVIGGPGDPTLVQDVLSPDKAGSRVTFVHGMVNLHVYGPILDAMCDTFPFVGGNALREIATHGVPVMAKLGTPWDGLLHADRCPDLLARNQAELIAMACRMADDPPFHALQRQRALELAQEFTRPDRMIDDVEAAIAATFDDGRDE